MTIPNGSRFIVNCLLWLVPPGLWLIEIVIALAFCIAAMNGKVSLIQSQNASSYSPGMTIGGKDSAGSDAGEIVLLLPNSMINNITSVKATAPGVSEDAQIRQSFSNSTHYALQVAIPQGMQNVIIAAAHVCT